MTNRVLEEYLSRVRDALSSLPEDERAAVVAETRAHIEEAIETRMAAEPGASLAEVTLQETRAFGDPAELAAARGASPRERPPRRSWPRWAKLLAGGVALLLVVIVAVDLIDKPAQYTPYQRDNVLEAHTALVNDTFEVRPDTQTLSITVRIERESGCTGVRVSDPTGEVVLDQWDACGDVTRSIEAKPSVTGRTGEWRIELRHRDFTGTVFVHTRGTLE